MADDLRAQLVKALWDAPYDHEDQADALLPVVRAYVSDLADQLERKAAEHAAEYPGAYADGLEAAAAFIRDRAADRG